MTHGIRFAQGLKILPVLGPVDTAATAAVTGFVDLNMANWVTFLVSFGNMTSDDSDVVNIIARASTEGTSAATEPTAINFNYRVSSAVATDLMGAITAGTSDGISSSDLYNASDLDNTVVVIDVDPSVVAAKSADMRWVSLAFTPTGPITILGVMAVIEHKYPGNTIPSST
jgi:hypothetical protein